MELSKISLYGFSREVLLGPGLQRVIHAEELGGLDLLPGE